MGASMTPRDPASSDSPGQGNADPAAIPLTVAGTQLLADPSGCLVWPDARMLVVADLHLEKGSSFARRGRFLPPFDTAETLDRLDTVVHRYEPETIICLGDSFHDRDAQARLDDQARRRLAHLMADRQWTWITGNHDPDGSNALGGVDRASITHGALIFRHNPTAGPVTGEIAGHLHPKAALRYRGHRLAGRCFATDGRRLLMPAFGAFTGGLDVHNPAVRGLFKDGFSAVILVRRRALVAPSARLIAN